MMAKSFSKGSGKSGFLSLDGAVASFAAASLAFLVYAMPGDLFSQLIAGTGLPSLIAAAEPPLGMKARFAVIAIVALVSFLGVWALLRALDRVPARAPRRQHVEAGVEMPRLRRGDAHPDAPPRPPLLAGHDFGEPFETWLTDESTSQQEPVEQESHAEPLELSDSDELHSLVLDDSFGADPEPETAPRQGEPVAIEALIASLPEAADESVANLMQRLEGGLARRERVAGAEPVQAPPAVEAPAGHRLRSAINDLERMAKRG